MHELAYVGILAAFILYVGVRERRMMSRHIDRINTRILVNGIRGKSTVTRLIMGIVKEDGRRAAGKTTGTSPRLFYWDREEEEPITRSLQGANISEQKIMTKKAAKRNVDTFVVECMAVNPEYQQVFETDFVKPQITVITNIVEDHLDVMGPTLDQIAESFSRTIPKNGYVVMPETKYSRFFRRAAEQRGSEVVFFSTESITDDYLQQFPYMMFAENAAIGLAVADILGIDRETAMNGMLKAPVDPGAMRIHRFGSSMEPSHFFNGFAANDASSTLAIWDKIQSDFPAEHRAVIMNCREDRVERTIQFAEDVLPKMNIDTLILTGKITNPVVEAVERGDIQAGSVKNMEKEPASAVIREVQNLPDGSAVFGVGNIHGGGEELAEAFEEISSSQGSRREKRKVTASRSRQVAEQHS
ncbi:poly-gamma-glutamate synthase PgsB [Alkalicoccus urumqiensis]|uniref:Poly-gamma-glutamate synthase PgsB n=1 Tax=Alkalicoccus urumqiensis TaxID=1548213 RepID=A0A2P6MI94_ALKUR|nr:poly-gamma-glutamate synthase PgsB [Alkalicoccus urumqiensis]PRO65977.1 poly-gamma-glutamate synthase PgsB [Alkalicoccus urumqiensis]